MPDEPLRTTTFTLTRADALAYEQAAGRLTPLGVFALIFWQGLTIETPSRGVDKFRDFSPC